MSSEIEAKPGDKVHPTGPSETGLRIPVIDPPPPKPEVPPTTPGPWGYFEGTIEATWIRAERKPFPWWIVALLFVGVLATVILTHWMSDRLVWYAQIGLDLTALILATTAALNFRDDGRHMKLTKDFAYVDPDGVRWEVPAGACVNGASIPWLFHRFIGGPYSGYYRYASVLHDHHCDIRVRPSPEVHRMFYRAMRNEGCAFWRANIMWLAVRLFGPRFKGVSNGK